jgi:hypothetical protein
VSGTFFYQYYFVGCKDVIQAQGQINAASRSQGYIRWMDRMMYITMTGEAGSALKASYYMLMLYAAHTIIRIKPTNSKIKTNNS